MTASNHDAIAERNYHRRVLRHIEAERLAVLAQRERDVHSVAAHMPEHVRVRLKAQLGFGPDPLQIGPRP
jgi:hypothetical protein